jgi:hypothetical protein
MPVALQRKVHKGRSYSSYEPRIDKCSANSAFHCGGIPLQINVRDKLSLKFEDHINGVF